MLNKEEQYTSIYFPERVLKHKEITYWGLLDIGSNFSKLIVDILASVCKIAAWMKFHNRNRMQYQWGIAIRDKQSGEVMFSIDTGAIKCINSKRFGALKGKT